MTGDICLQCQKILRTYSDRTVLPKFTCNVRTKFSEMSIFTDIPPGTRVFKMQISTDTLYHLFRSLKIDQENQHLPVTAGDFIQDIVATLLGRCKSLLDILEPLHWRRSDDRPSDLVTYWSYSLSMVRWKNSICFFWPDLQDALEFHENCHRYMHKFFLTRLDDLLSSRNYFAAAALLNTWYEGTSAMEDTPLVNISAKEHLLSSITHHLLHVYRILLPKTPNSLQRKTDLDELTLYCNMFPQTSNLLPAGWQIHRKGSFTRSILRSSGMLSISPPNVLQPLGRTATLKTYFPPGFLDLLCLDTEMQIAIEAAMQDFILGYTPSIQEEMLDLSPWILGVGLGVFSDLHNLEDIRDDYKDSILACVIAASQYAWNEGIDFYDRYLDRDGVTWSDLITDRDTVKALVFKWIKKRAAPDDASEP